MRKRKHLLDSSNGECNREKDKPQKKLSDKRTVTWCRKVISLSVDPFQPAIPFRTSF